MNTRYELLDDRLTRRADIIAVAMLAVLLAFLAMACSGCISPVAKSQKTLASIQYAKDAAMKGWGIYVAREQKRASSLPDGQREMAHARLLERRLEVDDSLVKFSKVWALAWSAAKYRNEAVAPAETLSALTELQTLTAH